jgi:hypothetical protein
MPNHDDHMMQFPAEASARQKSRQAVLSLAVVAALVVAVGIVLTVLSIRSDVVGHAPPTGSPLTSTVSSEGHATTAPASLPASPQPTAPSAAADLVNAWAADNRAAALAVATPNSVATLFAARYVPGLAIARGCSTAFPPLVCTYGPPGGASPTDAIYEIRVSQAGTGWFVSSVVVDN